ncbi:MAG TPA: glycosyltransferase [Pseudolabrys sp.]|jgi:glycosyltransferase involved in cell wall biosynthesis|nr:glycosyltransferase [Pseudolabrys sp.]
MIPAAQAAPRSLAGATVLQLVPALREDAVGHAAVEIALALLQSGARAIVAGEGGPLAGDLRAFGGEWLPMTLDTANPLRIRSNARALHELIVAERIDIVHAHCAAAAWSALAATHRQPVFLVTSFPDRPSSSSWLGARMARSLARGDRIIAPSSFMSRMMIERYAIPPKRITVIPRAVDTAVFSPAAVSADRIAALRRIWGVLPGMRIVLVPGRVAPWNGQMSVVDAARLIVSGGERNIAFVFAGEDRSNAGYARSLRRRAHTQSIDTLCRFVGHCADMPAALAAADVVVVPALQAPLSGRTVAEAQAMSRPVVATTLGVLPENVLCPPRMRDELRTGWLVRPGNVGEIARATAAALALPATAYDALGARARQFAEFMFSPQSVAAGIRGVYTSLLARDH